MNVIEKEYALTFSGINKLYHRNYLNLYRFALKLKTMYHYSIND
jgi:hypothetical protein